MNKKMKQEIRDSFNFPDAKHKYEFLMQAEVASAQDKKRKIPVPVVFRVTALAAAAAIAIGLWTNLRTRPDPGGKDFRGGSVIVTTAENTVSAVTTTADGSAAKPVTTVTAHDNETAVTTFTAATNAQGAVITSASPALGAHTLTSAVRHSGTGRTTAAVPGKNTTTTTVNKEIERSFEMKKLAAFLSALSISVSALPVNAGALGNDYMLNPDFDASEYYTTPPYGDSNVGIFKKFDNGQLIYDVDGNGVFDRMDPYWVYRCVTDGEYDSNVELSYELGTFIRENCDYDGDGDLDQWDAWVIIAYYIINNKPTAADIDWNTYDPTYVPERYDSTKYFNVTNISCELMYVDKFDQCLETYGLARSYITAGLIENGTLDLDVNEDGVVDIKDIAYIAVYYKNLDPLWEERVDDGIRLHYSYTKRVDLPEKVKNNIKKLCDDAMPEKNPKNFSTSGKEARCLEMIEYFLMHYPVQECYFDNKYYDTILSTDTSQYTLGDVLGIQALNRNVIIPREDDGRFDFYQDVFNEQFTAYYQNVLDGKQSIPDINGDGVADTEDYQAADEYMTAFFRNETIETTSMPKDIFEKFITDCDFNQNGVSGDIYDIMIAEIYIMYIDAYHPEEETVTTSEFSYQSNLSLLSTLEIDRSGDANCDGGTDLADAIFIMQSMANPDKYQLSQRGRFNADISEPGHGVTADDALEIQNRLLHNN
ncbi:hypothetical protein [Ruminococcus flavefaciens]|uniref:hypothetical protein n=1 Tax=Ruminococcus flavefaciens TaxID=1265 RepID=UPI00048D2CA3|nr:hypothetical protein [Ruminococcus flavefaciens]